MIYKSAANFFFNFWEKYIKNIASQIFYPMDKKGSPKFSFRGGSTPFTHPWASLPSTEYL